MRVESHAVRKGLRGGTVVLAAVGRVGGVGRVDHEGDRGRGELLREVDVLHGDRDGHVAGRRRLHRKGAACHGDGRACRVGHRDARVGGQVPQSEGNRPVARVVLDVVVHRVGVGGRAVFVGGNRRIAARKRRGQGAGGHEEGAGREGRSGVCVGRRFAFRSARFIGRCGGRRNGTRFVCRRRAGRRRRVGRGGHARAGNRKGAHLGGGLLVRSGRTGGRKPRFSRQTGRVGSGARGGVCGSDRIAGGLGGGVDVLQDCVAAGSAVLRIDAREHRAVCSAAHVGAGRIDGLHGKVGEGEGGPVIDGIGIRRRRGHGVGDLLGRKGHAIGGDAVVGRHVLPAVVRVGIGIGAPRLAGGVPRLRALLQLQGHAGGGLRVRAVERVGQFHEQGAGKVLVGRLRRRRSARHIRVVRGSSARRARVLSGCGRRRTRIRRCRGCRGALARTGFRNLFRRILFRSAFRRRSRRRGALRGRLFLALRPGFRERLAPPVAAEHHHEGQHAGKHRARRSARLGLPHRFRTAHVPIASAIHLFPRWQLTTTPVPASAHRRRRFFALFCRVP